MIIPPPHLFVDHLLLEALQLLPQLLGVAVAALEGFGQLGDRRLRLEPLGVQPLDLRPEALNLNRIRSRLRGEGHLQEEDHWVCSKHKAAGPRAGF